MTQFMTIREACKALGVTERSMRIAIKAKEIQCYSRRLPRITMVLDKRDLDEWYRRKYGSRICAACDGSGLAPNQTPCLEC